MDAKRSQLLKRLLEHGERHDREEPDRLRRYRNITHDTGEFLSLLVQALPARRVLEVGTSNGYSTVWLADALERTDGYMITIESDPSRAAEAETHLEEAAPEVQVALLTERIKGLTEHFKAHKKDHHSRRGLLMLVSQRKSQLEYLKRNDVGRYKGLIKRLGLRK